ncbi:multicopper oxidase domain-containing protein [Chromobacterium subtsugae]|uniref:multicopper oxidase domain-containing protein n=1 Tax=Chromobacterium subtsugae TaxID=251747 RepID=UPI000A80B133|nr:multicopper oxidase domain-containing protein [Chromobacterium subtsugae]
MGKLQNAKVGKVQRWRMIHGGVRDTIALEIRRREPISNESAQSISGLTAEQTQDYVNKECTGEPIPFTLVAADGLTMAQAMQKKRLVFQPGYRWDALMVFPQAGDYCLINKVGRSNIDLVQPYTRLLGMIHVNAANMPVVPDDIDGSIKRHLQNLLIKAAQDNYRSAVAKLVVADLRNDMKLTRFVPHADIQDSELTGQQRLAFNIDTQSVKGQSFYQIDGKPYDGGRIDRTLPLGGVDEWTLTSDFASHPFHIHVNPFQIVKIINPKGQDISGPMPQADDDDDQYHGMKGMWKDTLWIKSLFDGTSGGEKDAAAGRYTFIVRTRYQRYVGDFVLHCHILDHEDQGMMQNVRIVLPDAQGNLTAGHH